MAKKFLVNWALRHNGTKYKAGDIIEIDLPDHVLKSGVVTETDASATVGSESGEDEVKDIKDLTKKELEAYALENFEIKDLVKTVKEAKEIAKPKVADLAAYVQALVDEKAEADSENSDEE